MLGLFRRRPFLIRPLENTLIKLLRSLDFYDEPGRDKIAMGTACLSCFVVPRQYIADQQWRMDWTSNGMLLLLHATIAAL